MSFIIIYIRVTIYYVLQIDEVLVISPYEFTFILILHCVYRVTSLYLLLTLTKYYINRIIIIND